MLPLKDEAHRKPTYGASQGQGKGKGKGTDLISSANGSATLPSKAEVVDDGYVKNKTPLCTRRSASCGLKATDKLEFGHGRRDHHHGYADNTLVFPTEQSVAPVSSDPCIGSAVRSQGSDLPRWKVSIYESDRPNPQS